LGDNGAVSSTAAARTVDAQPSSTPAVPGEFSALTIGPYRVWPPVVLAPMAGITNAAFRTLCREHGAAVPLGPAGPGAAAPLADPAFHSRALPERPGAQPPDSRHAASRPAAFSSVAAQAQCDSLLGLAGPGAAAPLADPAFHSRALYVSEMITTRALVERDRKTMGLIRFVAGEHPRSVQLYGVDPAVVGRAVRIVVEDGLADHIDLNFGCPVPKVTRRGGGAALPYKRRLLAEVLRAAVREAGALPVTMKMRMGIDADHLTYLEAGRVAEDAGVAAVALHARTAAQHYSGQADWAAVAALKARLSIPVLGNGDIWEAADAVRMMRETGCDGVVVGRGCLGRPWLFGDLVGVFTGRDVPLLPTLGEVAGVMRRHAELLSGLMGEDRGVRDFRKHVSWYTKGFAVGSRARAGLGRVSSLAELEELLAGLAADQPWPAGQAGTPRGRTSGTRRVALPEGWLEDPWDVTVPGGAEEAHSGG
jgi:nifR3 family TIM-barrel protein